MAPVRKVDLDALALTVVERVDAQYGSPRTFIGVPLEALIDRIPAPAHADLALLHFGNGVVVPLPFRDRAVMNRLQPWVARGMHLIDKGMTVGEFEPITNKLHGYFDVPVIKFAGNKLVVAERWHPDVPARAERDLSPWMHVDSLVAIELVNAAAYNAMFDVQPKRRAGLALFRQSCQFCHGVRQVGAKFGPDFVDPLPVHKWRKPAKQLYWHMTYRRRDAVERGEMMPALKYMTEQDASEVWSWLRAAADRPLQPYRPAR
jgi:mono/diheme cytochrome c family protein